MIEKANSGVSYTAKCCRCGYMIHQHGGPFVDGTVREHAAQYVDHNGLTASHACHGVFVSIMGRTAEETRAVAQQLATHQEDAEKLHKRRMEAGQFISRECL